MTAPTMPSMAASRSSVAASSPVLSPRLATAEPLASEKFQDPERTLSGVPRAKVELERLQTLWFHTGSVCNLSCHHCYVESGPGNQRLAFLTPEDIAPFLAEAAEPWSAVGAPVTEEIGFTGGEPFMNKQMPALLAQVLEAGFRVLVLSNATRPLQNRAEAVRALVSRFGDRLQFRVSLDHYSPLGHESERSEGSWAQVRAGLQLLAGMGAHLSLAGRQRWAESEESLRAGYDRLQAELGLGLDVSDSSRLVLFPEMDARLDIPEISVECWKILGKRPQDVMCATSRMVLKRQGAGAPVVVACTLLPYDRRFECGADLAEASAPVSLNHPHCARFCVLGGASCSVAAA